MRASSRDSAARSACRYCASSIQVGDAELGSSPTLRFDDEIVRDPLPERTVAQDLELGAEPLLFFSSTERSRLFCTSDFAGHATEGSDSRAGSRSRTVPGAAPSAARSPSGTRRSPAAFGSSTPHQRDRQATMTSTSVPIAVRVATDVKRGPAQQDPVGDGAPGAGKNFLVFIEGEGLDAETRAHALEVLFANASEERARASKG